MRRAISKPGLTAQSGMETDMKNRKTIKAAICAALCLAFVLSACSCSYMLSGLLKYYNGSAPESQGAGTASPSGASSGKTSEASGTKSEGKELGDLIDIETGSGAKRNGIADIVDKISPAVVAINVYGTAYDYFYREYPTEGAGSGVILTSDGYILTNNHVVTGGNTITVFLESGVSYSAKIIGADSKSDLALLKIDAKDLSAVKIGRSSTLRVGDQAIAVGNPLGELQGSVSAGIISALDRTMKVDGNTLTLLQTDAAINPGNSGGGLFDSNGELIGIVTAKNISANVEGLGFAIPIDTALPILYDLQKYGYVTGRPALDIETLLISSRYAAYARGLKYTGLYVYTVKKGSQAEADGLRSGDYIRSVDGETITTDEQFWEIIETKKVGDKITVELYRGDTEITLSVTVTEAK